MTFEPRVLDSEPVTTIDDYVRRGGGRGLEAARRLGPAGIVDEVEASGLRGRGGAGFPTGVKWRTVLENRSPDLPATVVVNMAEGEPGSFKDRAIVRRNPYRMLEGALVAAVASGSDAVVVAAKATFRREIDRVRAAIDEIGSAGWSEGLRMFLVEGPSEYLYGEETALLEVVAGRNPFPRITPPFRRGVDDVEPRGRTAAAEPLAGSGDETVGAPALVNNVETLSNVGSILAEGADWFRQVGTDQSPGTIVCTVSGYTRRHGVAEFPMGTPLSEVVEVVGGGARRDRRIVAAMSGVANALVPEDKLGTPLTYEHMQEIGSGLGAAGFIVFDDTVDPVSVAHGVSRFLAVESCGQCTPCKQDGLAISELLDLLRRSEGGAHELAAVEEHVRTVADEARCYLAQQHQMVVGSVLALFGDRLRERAQGALPPAGAEVISPIADFDGDQVVLDEKQPLKQPDWTFEPAYSGQSPSDRVRGGDLPA